jgi:hypothetical protein
MDDGSTHVTKYPYNGATCAMQLPGSDDLLFVNESLLDNKPKVEDPAAALELCPNDDDDNSDFLKDGKTKPVPYPKVGYNCKIQETESLSQLSPKDLPNNKPALPNFDESKLEHCPDFNERFTLVNGTTRAIPYPRKGYNCQAGWAVAQLDPKNLPNNAPALPNFDGSTLEHCPDFNERFTLVNGTTRAVPYP